MKTNLKLLWATGAMVFAVAALAQPVQAARSARPPVIITTTSSSSNPVSPA